MLWALMTVIAPVRRALEWIVARLVKPARPGAAALTADELQELLARQPDRFHLDDRAAAMIREVISLSEMKVREIMTPRVDMAGIDADLALPAVREAFRRRRLLWAVVYEEQPDRVLGILHARDVFLHAPPDDLRTVCTPLPVVPEVARVDHLVRTFRDGGTTRALVVDEYGGTAGLVTLEQVVAEILGDLFRSDPEEPIIKPAGNGIYRVDGALPIRAWNEVLGGNLPIDRFETLGGYVLDLSGRLPREGDQLADDRFHYRVLRMRGRRVRKVEVQEREREAVKP
jgi:putative hemolysin